MGVMPSTFNQWEVAATSRACQMQVMFYTCTSGNAYIRVLCMHARGRSFWNQRQAYSSRDPAILPSLF